MLKISKIFFFLLIFSLHSQIIARLGVKLSALTCESLNENLTRIALCQIKAIQRDLSELSVRILLMQEVKSNVTIRAAIKRRGYEHLKSLYEIEIDACAFLRNKRRNPIASAFYTMFGLEKYSNMNHTCPYAHDLIIDRYRCEEQYLQILPIPLGHYVLYTTWKYYNNVAFNLTTAYQIFERH